jgi:hypothetical protein
MLRLLLKIVVGWFALSLLCSALWVLILELARRRARQAPTPIGTSTQTLSERQVDTLLSAPHASNPVGDRATTEIAGEREPSSATRVGHP